MSQAISVKKLYRGPYRQVDAQVLNWRKKRKALATVVEKHRIRSLRLAQAAKPEQPSPLPTNMFYDESE